MPEVSAARFATGRGVHVELPPFGTCKITDIALDANYRAELQRGGAMLGFPDAASETLEQFDEQIVKSAENVEGVPDS